MKKGYLQCLTLVFVTFLFTLLYHRDLEFPTTKLEFLLLRRRANLYSLFKSRIDLVERVCQSEPAEEEKEEIPTKSKSWFAHPGHKLLFCHMGKHGSTTWASYFHYMYSGKAPGGPGPSMQTRARRWEDAAYSPREKLEVIHSNQRGKSSYNYFSFFVCRNPVSKLSSIYRYNLKRSVKGRPQPGISNESPPSFPQYLQLLASGNISINLDTTLANCQPCSHRWDAVVHMETFDKDSQAILRASGVNIKLIHLNKRRSGGRYGQEGSVKEMKRLLVGVSREAIQYIANKYRRDFLLCGYNQTLNLLESMLEKGLRLHIPNND